LIDGYRVAVIDNAGLPVEFIETGCLMMRYGIVPEPVRKPVRISEFQSIVLRPKPARQGGAGTLCKQAPH